MTDRVANVGERPSQAALGLAPASIMVHVDFDAGSDERITLAADWAAKFNAALIGGRRLGAWAGNRRPVCRSNWNDPKKGPTASWRR